MAGTNGPVLIPVFQRDQRYVNGVPLPSRKTLRLREKYIILLVLCTFSIVCMCAFLYLPNMHDKVSMKEMRQRLQEAGDTMLLPKPRVGIEKGKVMRTVDENGDSDKKVLQGKIDRAWEKQKIDEALSKQNIHPKEAEDIKAKIEVDKEILREKLRLKQQEKEVAEKKAAQKVVKDHDGHPGSRGGRPAESSAQERREKVKQVSTVKVVLRTSTVKNATPTQTM